MKLIKSKKSLTCLALSIFTIINSNSLFADEITDVANSSAVNVVPAQSSDAIGNMLLQSVSLMGIAYKWGGNTPDTGMDCSGFVRYVFKKSLGINLPRTAAEMAKVGKRISINELEPGDLIFFNTRRGSNTHIGIYLGNNKFIQSPRTGENIQISELNGYWVKHFNGAKRVVQEDQDNDGNTTLVNYSDVNNEALPVAARKGHYSKKSRHRGKVYSSKQAKSKKKSIHRSKSKSSRQKPNKKKKS